MPLRHRLAALGAIALLALAMWDAEMVRQALTPRPVIVRW